MTKEEEIEYRKSCIEKFTADGEIVIATKAVVNYEVVSSYLQLTWAKGLVFLVELDILGYKIVPK